MEHLHKEGIICSELYFDCVPPFENSTAGIAITYIIDLLIKQTLFSDLHSLLQGSRGHHQLQPQQAYPLKG